MGFPEIYKTKEATIYYYEDGYMRIETESKKLIDFLTKNNYHFHELMKCYGKYDDLNHEEYNALINLLED